MAINKNLLGIKHSLQCSGVNSMEKNSLIRPINQLSLKVFEISTWGHRCETSIMEYNKVQSVVMQIFSGKTGGVNTGWGKGRGSQEFKLQK